MLQISRTLKKYPKSKNIIVAPTRPRVAQHEASCRKFLESNENEICLLTGNITPEHRILAFNQLGRKDPVEYVDTWENVLEGALQLEKEYQEGTQ